MAHVDNIALANKKNFVNKTKLMSEISRIDREKCTVMRLLNNEKQRFKNKYSKFDVFTERGTEPSDVVMYETHNPGFCYRRNGECRMPPSPIKNTSLGFEGIHVLIFTNGELDIDKVLCLHLLSTHRTETLTPPPREQRTLMFLAKQQSPLERLLERTKRRWPEDRLTRLLPVYVLDYSRTNPNSKSDNLIRDGRLAARLIINEKINVLIRSVMTALEKTNWEMLTDLVNKAKNERYLKNMLTQPKIRDFLKNLRGLNVISCCESFCLTLPFRIIPNILDVRTPSGQLENLLYQIRKNIFKLPVNCCWNEDCDEFGSYSDDENEPHQDNSPFYNEREIYSQNLNVFEFRNKSKPGSAKSGQRSATTDSSKSSPRQTNDPGLSDIAEVGSDNAPFLPKLVERNIILSRKRSPVVEKKSAREKSLEISLNSQQIKDIDFEKIANLLYKKANNAIKRDLEMLEKNKSTENKIRLPVTSSNDLSDLIQCDETEEQETKILLKQTKCAACAEKWREQLPTPKTSHINKNVDYSVNDDTLQEIMTNSSHIISTLIDREMKFWKDYKVEKQDSRVSSPRFRFSPKNSIDKNSIIEIIDLNELALAKVRQEIREHETKKKLKEFLSK